MMQNAFPRILASSIRQSKPAWSKTLFERDARAAGPQPPGSGLRRQPMAAGRMPIGLAASTASRPRQRQRASAPPAMRQDQGLKPSADRGAWWQAHNRRPVLAGPWSQVLGHRRVAISGRPARCGPWSPIAVCASAAWRGDGRAPSRRGQCMPSLSAMLASSRASCPGVASLWCCAFHSAIGMPWISARASALSP